MSNDPMNPYAPPSAALDVAAPLGATGSLEDAVAGRYNFTIGEVMSEAWGLVKGFKASFWGAAVVMYILLVVALLVWGGISAAIFGRERSQILGLIVNGVIGALLWPLFIGLVALGVRRAAGLPVSFSYLHKAPVVIGAGLLTTLLTYVGFALLVIPGLYLSIAYGMTLPLLAFHELGVWKAMETSRKALTHRWFSVFGLYLLVGLLVGVSALPLGIPLIWTVPWALLVMGVLYRRIFGVPAPAAAP